MFPSVQNASVAYTSTKIPVFRRNVFHFIVPMCSYITQHCARASVSSSIRLYALWRENDLFNAVQSGYEIIRVVMISEAPFLDQKINKEKMSLITMAMRCFQLLTIKLIPLKLISLWNIILWAYR